MHTCRTVGEGASCARADVSIGILPPARTGWRTDETGWIDSERVDGREDGGLERTDGRTDGWMDGWVDGMNERISRDGNILLSGYREGSGSRGGWRVLDHNFGRRSSTKQLQATK